MLQLTGRSLFGKALRPICRIRRDVIDWTIQPARRQLSAGFLVAYEQLLCEFSLDYGKVSHRWQDPQALATFFEGDYQTTRFPNRHAAMMEAASALFERYGPEGEVTVHYTTRLHWKTTEGFWLDLQEQ